MRAADVNRRSWPRHTWSGLHDGCDACVILWPAKTITAREALERWPAPVRSKHEATRLPQEFAVLLPGRVSQTPRNQTRAALKKSSTSKDSNRGQRRKGGRPRKYRDVTERERHKKRRARAKGGKAA